MKHLTFIFILLFAGLVGTTFGQTDQSEAEKRASESAYGVWTAVKTATFPDFPISHGDSVWTWEEDSETTDFADRYAKYGYSADHSLGIGANWDGETGTYYNYFHRVFEEPVQVPESGLKIYWDIKLTKPIEESASFFIIFIINGIEYKPNMDGSNATADSWTTQWFWDFQSQDGNHTILNITEFSEFYIRLTSFGDNSAYISHIRFNDSTMICLTGNSISAIEPLPGITPISYTLKQNYPNPFNPSTNIVFSITKVDFVNLTIFNTLGQNVATLVDEKLPIGSYNYSFDGQNLPSGTYFYKLTTGSGFSQVKKMILMK